MFDLSLSQAEHTRRYSIRPRAESGWEVTLEEDRALRSRDLYRDWHRVERARARFEREVFELTSQGWRIEPEPVAAQ